MIELFSLSDQFPHQILNPFLVSFFIVWLEHDDVNLFRYFPFLQVKKYSFLLNSENSTFMMNSEEHN